MIKALIYDCDGVLVNSDNSIISYYNWLTKKAGLEPIDWSNNELKKQVFSYTEKDIVKILSKDSLEIRDKLYNIIKEERYEQSFEDIILEANIKSVLEKLKSMGIILAVDTNRGSSLSSLLDYFNISEYFSYTVTSRDVVNPKPDPEGIYKICNNLNISLDSVLFIGDSSTDYYAALHAGVSFCSYGKKLYDAKMITNHLEILDFFK